jgi:hypothetical protein
VELIEKGNGWWWVSTWEDGDKVKLIEKWTDKEIQRHENGAVRSILNG